MSKSIKFPSEHYVGMIVRAQSEGTDYLPLAFMTPEGSDKAAEKRKSTVDGWVSQNANQSVWNPTTQRYVTQKGSVPKPVVLKNEPMAGFKLLDEIKRGGYGWGTGNVKWRVEDPRGFELEITSPNLMQILACSVVDKGEILDMCMWAREGGDNVLVPVSSEVYTTAMENTERSQKSVSMRDIKMGDYAVLQNGTTGRYYGKMFALENDYSSSEYGYHGRYREDLTVKLVARHIFVDEEGKSYHIIASPKLAEVTPGEPLSTDEAEKAFAKMHKNDKWTRYGGGWGTYAYQFSKTKPVITRERKEVKWDNNTSPVFEVNGVWYVETERYYGRDEVRAEEINTHEWENGNYIVRRHPHDNSYWYRERYQTKFSRDDLKLRGIKGYRPFSRITTDKGTVYTVDH